MTSVITLRTWASITCQDYSLLIWVSGPPPMLRAIRHLCAYLRHMTHGIITSIHHKLVSAYAILNICPFCAATNSGVIPVPSDWLTATSASISWSTTASCPFVHGDEQRGLAVVLRLVYFRPGPAARPRRPHCHCAEAVWARGDRARRPPFAIDGSQKR